MTLGIGGANLNIANGIREFGAATPRAAAVVDGDREISFAELDERSSRLGNGLLAKGLRPGERVGVLLGNRAEYVEAACGLAKAGLVLVPVNPRSTSREAAFVLGHSGAKALIVDNALAEVGGPGVDAHDIKTVLSIDGTELGPAYEEALHNARPIDPLAAPPETDPFCIAYTSGTTGDPKGVLISHRSRVLTFYGTALEWGLGPGRRTIAVAPMYHGAGFAFGYAAPFTGGTVAMLRAFDPEALLAMIQETPAQSVFLVPAHAQMLRGLGESTINEYDTSSLDTVYFNAAPLPQELKLWFLDTFPHVAAHELYGSTEAGIVTNLRPPDMRRKERCVGPPWFMTEVRLTDPDSGEVLDGPGTGELYSRSPYLMNGYLDNPEATIACTTDDGFLSSGDIAMRDEDGYYYIVDRTKDMIISGGVNIYPREVEEIVATHPSVREVAVIGLPDEKWGESVTACVVLADGAALDAASLEDHCRGELSGFKIPKRWEVVDALPRNAAMKVLKRDLRTQLA